MLKATTTDVSLTKSYIPKVSKIPDVSPTIAQFYKPIENRNIHEGRVVDQAYYKSNNIEQRVVVDRTIKSQTVALNPNQILTKELSLDMKQWEELIRENVFELEGHRDHLPTCFAHMLYCVIVKEQYNLSYFFVKRIECAKATPITNLPDGMILTSLYRYVMEAYPYLDNGIYDIVERGFAGVMIEVVVSDGIVGESGRKRGEDGLQETNMKIIESVTIKMFWGNSSFDYALTSFLGNSGAIMGTRVPSSSKLFINSIYAPQDLTENRVLWDYILYLIDRWDGDCVIMWEFNEVRIEQERYGLVFNVQAIRGTLVDGEWIVDPLAVKRDKEWVLDYGTNKSPGHDGFTFEFFHRYWKLLEHDIVAADKDFFCFSASIRSLKLWSLNSILKRHLTLYGLFSGILIDSLFTLFDLFFMDDAIFVGVLKLLESIKRNFYNGVDRSERKMAWISWNKVLASKKYGSLGVSSFYDLNRALLFKWIWRFFSHGSCLWTRFTKAIYGEDGALNSSSSLSKCSPWLDIIREVTVLRTKGINLLDLIRKKVGNGLNTLFWEDHWLDDLPLKHTFLRLYALNKYKQIIVVKKINNAFMVDTFRRPPRGGAEEVQLGFLLSRLDGLILKNTLDCWVWSLEAMGEFSLKSIHQLIDNLILPNEEVATRKETYVLVGARGH
nr:RNA-directed DNA polymerase, eukaryota, reverse transcriptase zinc-binding domain protein [Tanacetum cinerariifolium]